MSEVFTQSKPRARRHPSPERSPWRKRIVRPRRARAPDARRQPQNWALHSESQRRVLRATLGTVGWVGQVIVNRATGHIVDGICGSTKRSSGRAERAVVYVE